MALRILVVHEFGVTRKITQGYIMTEFSDAVTDVVASPYEAVKLLEEKKYDIIFCGLEMADMDGFAVYNHMRTTAANRETSFIIMSSTYDAAQFQRVSKRGIECILPIPFTPLQLREVVNHACDPRKSRVYPRYIIPGAKTLVQFPKHRIMADVLNISNNGVLCDFTYSKLPVEFLHPCLISIQFPDDYGSTNAGKITACLLRLTVDSWQNDNTPQKIRAAWKFIQVPAAAQKALDEALEKAHLDMTANEEETKVEVH